MNFGLIDIKNQSSVLYLFFPIQSLPLVPSLLYYIWYSHCEFQVCYVNIQFQSSILVRQRSQAEVKVRIHIQFLKTWMYYVIYIYGVYVNLISKRIPRRSWRQYRDMCRSKWYQHGIKNHSYTCVRTKQGETTYSVLPFPWVSEWVSEYIRARCGVKTITSSQSTVLGSIAWPVSWEDRPR